MKNNYLLPLIIATFIAVGGWTFGFLQKSFAEGVVKRVDRNEKVLDEIVPTLYRIETIVIQIKKSMEKYDD